MADDKQKQGPAAPNVDAGAAFRTEMWLQNFLLGYWQHMLTVLVVVLIGFFIYGQYGSWYRSQQRGTAADIAFLEIEAPKPGMSGYADADREALKGLADRMVAVADAGSGPARVEALLKAAEWYRIAGASEPRRKALENAAADGAEALRYSAVAALANMDIEANDEAAATARLRGLMNDLDGFYAQRAALDLGYALEHFGKGEEARLVYEKFLVDWPDAPTAEQVRDRLAGLGSAG